MFADAHAVLDCPTKGPAVLAKQNTSALKAMVTLSGQHGEEQAKPCSPSRTTAKPKGALQ